MGRLRGAMMFLPADNPGMLKDATIYGVDSIVLNLEGAISLAKKNTSRFLIFQAIKTFGFSSTETVVHISSLDAGGIDDVHAMVRTGIDVIRLPKTTCAQDVLDIEEVILEAEEARDRKPGSTRMMAAIENPRGVLGTAAIAHSSKHLIDIALRSEDCVTAMKTKRYVDRNNGKIFFARSTIVHTAHAARIAALNTIFADMNDVETLRKETEFVRQLDSDGESVIHPRQIAVVSSVYTPSQKEIDNVLNIFCAIEEANAKGSGVVALNSRTIDKPFVERVERVLALAKAAGAYAGPEGQEG